MILELRQKSKSLILRIALFSLLISFQTQDVQARSLELEVFTGLPKTLIAQLDISQSGFPDLNLSPDFRSDPFETPAYYIFRLGLRDQDRVWALDFIHHKLILNEPTVDIQSFTITHGYNIASVLYIQDFRSISLSAGIGIILPHPENEVRNRSLDEKKGIKGSGYYLTGPAVQVGMGRRVNIHNNLFLSAEARLIFSKAKIPVQDGEARITELSAHLITGLGIRF
ncbi:MAG: hypothetical protein KOO60_04950 [Gemmatimonadales bacterium]|nr:hypothetical protein [Gemmatimonadales bacterium]